ncbi:hypothetical protein ACF0H5_002627 [Mactra antiquata]
MSSFLDTVKKERCGELHRVVKGDDDKYLCYTKSTTGWTICVTDGVSLWKVEMDEDTVNDIPGVTSMDAFFIKFRNGFQAGDLSVSVVGKRITLYVGKGSAPLTIDLYETNAAVKKTEMQSVLFRLADSATELSTALEKSNQLVDSLKAQKGAGQGAAFMDLGPKKGSPTKNKASKVGMSVLNPSSKKRKAAKGVVFN